MFFNEVGMIDLVQKLSFSNCNQKLKATSINNSQKDSNAYLLSIINCKVLARKQEINHSRLS